MKKQHRGTENAEPYSFYRIPKQLFTDERFDDLSTEAKLLYGLLLDRMSLSDKNGWRDENGYVYQFFTVKQVQKLLHYGHEKVSRMFSELEEKHLIDRKKQGQGKAPIIRINCILSDSGKADAKTAEFPTSRLPKIGHQDLCFSDASNTKKNKTDFNNINQSIMRCDADEIENCIKEQIEYDILAERYNPDTLNEIVLLMSDVLSGCSETVHIGGCDYAREVVCSRFLKLSCEHISYVLDHMEKNTSDVRNIRAYLLTSLYNAPATMDHYYQSAVNHDLCG